jgi:DNA-binding NtrC family response regulator
VTSFSPVDVRSLVEKHEFDPDLCARLAELTLRLPALRDFAEDVPDHASLMLAQLVESRLCPPRRLSIAALNALRHHAWPGNLAELESVVKDLGLTAPLEVSGRGRTRRRGGAPTDRAGPLVIGPLRPVAQRRRPWTTRSRATRPPRCWARICPSRRCTGSMARAS